MIDSDPARRTATPGAVRASDCLTPSGAPLSQRTAGPQSKAADRSGAGGSNRPTASRMPGPTGRAPIHDAVRRICHCAALMAQAAKWSGQQPARDRDRQEEETRQKRILAISRD